MGEVLIDFKVLMTIWERVQDGCYTPDTIKKCDACGHVVLNLNNHEIDAYLQALVEMGWAEWRSVQGSRQEGRRGDIPDICVPKDAPLGSSLPGLANPSQDYMGAAVSTHGVDGK